MSSSTGKKRLPPTPAPAATILTDNSDTIMTAIDEQRKKLKSGGYKGSLLTGVLGKATTQTKTLLGGSK